MKPQCDLTYMKIYPMAFYRYKILNFYNSLTDLGKCLPTDVRYMIVIYLGVMYNNK